jgi:hypothetical protein
MSDELIRQPAASGELTIQQLAGNMEKLRDVMKSVMIADTDYGVIPGTKSKPTLLKPGGEKLAQMFRFAPEYTETIRELANGHREYDVKCRLIHMPTDSFAGEASATCSTLESKYRYRGGARKCPMCGKEAIKKSKFPPRNKPNAQPGYYCFAKVGGCGAEFEFDDKDIIGQSEVKTENPDIADSYNTVKQIAQKRAFLSAIKTATASSELFTIDVGDPDNETTPHHEPDPAAARDQQRQSKAGEEDQTQHEQGPRKATMPEWDEFLKLLKSCGAKSDADCDAIIAYAKEGQNRSSCWANVEIMQDTIANLQTMLGNGDTPDGIRAAALREPAGASA